MSAPPVRLVQVESPDADARMVAAIAVLLAEDERGDVVEVNEDDDATGRPA